MILKSITQLNIHIRWTIYSFVPVYHDDDDDHGHVITRQWYVSARMGDLEMLQELWSQAQHVYRNVRDDSTRHLLQKFYLRNCWNAKLAEIIAKCGHIRCLQWVTSMGCPWDIHECCTVARRGGYMNIVQWACNESSFAG